MKTNKDKERFLELKSQNFSLREIEKLTGISLSTLARFNKEFEIEAKNIQTLNKEDFQKKIYLIKSNELNNFETLLNNLNKELNKRDLKEVKTEKLLELKLKILEQLKAYEDKTELSYIVESKKGVEIEELQTEIKTTL